MEKIILFYKYVAIRDPSQILDWQRSLCTQLSLVGRILLAHEGINGTLAGEQENLNAYALAMEAHPLFGGIDFKESEGTKACFPRLQVKIKTSIVNMGAYDASTIDMSLTGEHLEPSEAHALLSNRPEDLIVLDARNNFESRIGTFEGAITPNIDNFRDFPAYLDEHADLFKDKQVLMFCTGGVRCEPATAYLNAKGVAKRVMQVKGGIHRYAEQYPEGHFRGKNYVFDDRVAVRITPDILSTCDICNAPCDDYTHCINASCNKMFLSCTPCISTFDEACSEHCQTLLAQGSVKRRPRFKRVTLEQQTQHIHNTHEKPA